MLTNRGLINKIGTRSMALVAREAGVPFYTLCGSEKFLPPGFRPHQQPDILIRRYLVGCGGSRRQRSAHFFDFTPLEALSGIVDRAGYFAGGGGGSLARGDQAASGAGELCQRRNA